MKEISLHDSGFFRRPLQVVRLAIQISLDRSDKVGTLLFLFDITIIPYFETSSQ